jgi:ferritin-like metal-binding protein YciE
MQDIYYAERHILKALPKMTKAAQNDELKQALMHHREETQGQVSVCRGCSRRWINERVGRPARRSTA